MDEPHTPHLQRATRQVNYLLSFAWFLDKSMSTLDSTLGAAFLGCLAAAIFYGITNIQTFIYFRRYHDDGKPFRSLIFVLWILDTVHIALIMHAMYFYMVTNFANPIAILSPTWSIMVHVIITSMSDFIVRSIFCRRVWRPMGNLLLVILIMTSSLVVFVGGLGFSVRGFQVDSYARFSEFSWVLYTSLGSGVVADALIAISLCVLLSRSRTGFKKTDSIVNLLMLYTINTGLLTSICATTCFITYATMPNNFVFIAFYFTLSKLYFNSLLGTLNARSVLREQSTAGVVSFPLTPTLGSRSDGTRGLQSSPSTATGSGPPLTITVETSTDKELSSIDTSYKWKQPPAYLQNSASDVMIEPHAQ